MIQEGNSKRESIMEQSNVDNLVKTQRKLHTTCGSITEEQRHTHMHTHTQLNTKTVC